MSQSPLQSLVVDDDAIHDELLTYVLKDSIRLTPSGGIIYTELASRLNVRSRVLLAILGSAALYRLGHRLTSSVTPKELEALTGIPGGTLRPALRDLVSRRLVRSQNSQYDIPPYAIESVQRVLQ